MSDTSELLLGVIAAAVAIMAIVQVGAIVAGLRAARRVEQLASDLEATVKPLIANLTALSAEASRAATLAASQVERFDQVCGDLASKVEQTLAGARHETTLRDPHVGLVLLRRRRQDDSRWR